MRVKNKHEFALCIEQILPLTKSFTLTDRDLVFRIQHVLRLQVADSLVLFNGTHHATALITASNKTTLVFELHNHAENKKLLPITNWLLPVLEREAFEAALYSLTVLGATSIQPVITEKSRRQWGSSKDLERAQRIMIAAAEQSKQFVLPLIQPAVQFITMCHSETLSESHQIKKIFFDPTGISCTQFVQDVKGSKELVVCIGPEGDLTPEEKETLKNNNFISYALTPTILRACDAVMVAQGIIRSLV